MKNLRKLIRNLVKEAFDQPNMDSWSAEDIKNAAKTGDFKPFNFSQSTKEGSFNQNIEDLHNNIIKKCPYIKDMDYKIEKKNGYYELMFTFYKDYKSAEHIKHTFGITISVKYYTESKPVLNREKGSISYSAYFHIENVVDKTLDPERVLKPEEDQYDEEEPFDNQEDFKYEDEEFLNTINANTTAPKANNSNDFSNDHINIICSKIKKFDDYVKVTYDFDIF